MRKPSAYSAIGLLDAQAKGLVKLSDEYFDQCFDAVTELLERANNMKAQAFTPSYGVRNANVRGFDAEGVELDGLETTSSAETQHPVLDQGSDDPEGDSERRGSVGAR